MVTLARWGTRPHTRPAADHRKNLHKAERHLHYISVIANRIARRYSPDVYFLYS